MTSEQLRQHLEYGEVQQIMRPRSRSRSLGRRSDDFSSRSVTPPEWRDPEESELLKAMNRQTDFIISIYHRQSEAIKQTKKGISSGCSVSDFVEDMGKYFMRWNPESKFVDHERFLQFWRDRIQVFIRNHQVLKVELPYEVLEAIMGDIRSEYEIVFQKVVTRCLLNPSCVEWHQDMHNRRIEAITEKIDDENLFKAFVNRMSKPQIAKILRQHQLNQQFTMYGFRALREEKMSLPQQIAFALRRCFRC